MGVKDLWQLLEPIGRRVSVETLEGKILAIDASIWITQFVKAMRDEDGKVIKNAHLIGTMRRVLKLLFNRIRPVFVFDGATPMLKLRTTRARKTIRDRQEGNLRKAAERLLMAQIKQHVIKQSQNTVDNKEEISPKQCVPTFSVPPSKGKKTLSSDTSKTTEIVTDTSNAYELSSNGMDKTTICSEHNADDGEDVIVTNNKSNESKRSSLPAINAIVRIMRDNGDIVKGRIITIRSTGTDNDMNGYACETDSISCYIHIFFEDGTEEEFPFPSNDIELISSPSSSDTNVKSAVKGRDTVHSTSTSTSHSHLPSSLSSSAPGVISVPTSRLHKLHRINETSTSTSTSLGKYLKSIPSSTSDIHSTGVRKGKGKIKVIDLEAIGGVDILEENDDNEDNDNNDNEKDMSDVNWVDGYSDLPAAKVLRDYSDDDDSSDDSDGAAARFELPENADEIDTEALAALPAHLRKEVVEDARRRERQRKRQRYMPVAADPQLFSQTQLANFLRSSQLNKRIDDVQRMVEKESGGRRIAADGNRKFILEKPKPMPMPMAKMVDDSPPPISRVKRVVLDEDEDEDEDEDDMSWIHDVEVDNASTEITATSNNVNITNKLRYEVDNDVIENEEKEHIVNAMNGGDDDDGGGGGGFFVDSQSDQKTSSQQDINKRKVYISKPVPATTTWICDKCTLCNTSLLLYCEACGCAKSDIPTSAVFNTTTQEQSTLLSDMMEAAESEVIQEEAFDDVDWESGEEISVNGNIDEEEKEEEVVGNNANKSSSHVTTVSTVNKAPIKPYNSPMNLVNSNERDRGVGVEGDGDGDDYGIGGGGGIFDDDYSAGSGTAAFRMSSTNSTAVLARAVDTASRMADWAGRAVQKAIRQHLSETSSAIGIGRGDFSSATSISTPADVLHPPYNVLGDRKGIISSLSKSSAITTTTITTTTTNDVGTGVDVGKVNTSTRMVGSKRKSTSTFLDSDDEEEEEEEEVGDESMMEMETMKTMLCGGSVPQSPDNGLNSSPNKSFSLSLRRTHAETMDNQGPIRSHEDVVGMDVQRVDDDDITCEGRINAINKSSLEQRNIVTTATLTANTNTATESYLKANVDNTQTHTVASSQTLNNMLEDAQIEEYQARKQRHQALRNTETMTEEMAEEVRELLQVLGLPYIVAPFEAEAQCAMLEELKLVDGVVTEDSDAFLFGAKTVYRNIFDEKKYVEVYLAEDARLEMGLSRNELVSLAYLLGSDYTEGVRGVGVVNAMEIVQTFNMKADGAQKPEEGVMEGLRKFKDWLEGFDVEVLDAMKVGNESSQDTKGLDVTAATTTDSGIIESKVSLVQSADEKLLEFQRRHRGVRTRWSTHDGFPDVRVATEYLYPRTDRTETAFSWDLCVDSLTTEKENRVGCYCAEKLGWTDQEIRSKVWPVLKKFAESTVYQRRIDSYFTTYHDNTRFAKIRSDRLRSAVVAITGDEKVRTDVATARRKNKGNITKTNNALQVADSSSSSFHMENDLIRDDNKDDVVDDVDVDVVSEETTTVSFLKEDITAVCSVAAAVTSLEDRKPRSRRLSARISQSRK
eukprot:gene4934-9846_t